MKKVVSNYKPIIVLIFFIIIWNFPVPSGLSIQAWHLFALFISTIFAVIINAMPVFVASIMAMSIAILTNTLTPAEAYSGFSKSFILLILSAFLVARGVVKSGLGKRIAYLIIKKFGKSTLGLGYSMTLTDIIIAPAFPSNTARSGVLYPIIHSLASDSGSKVSDGTRHKMGNFLMMNGMAGISISSGMWLTAMGANPIGAKMAEEFGVHITFFSWFLNALIPSLIAFLVIPYVLFKLYPPEINETPNAPEIAKSQLKKMGPISKNELIMLITFIGMVFFWSLSGYLKIDKTAIAFVGLSILMISKIFTIHDLKQEGEALGTFIWFAILYTMSSYLNKFGFMNLVGTTLASYLEGMSWPLVYVSLISLYVMIHYFFVSQTAQILALLGVFLGIGVNAGVPPKLMTFMLLFASNFHSCITPQGSSANVLFAGSGYLTSNEIYKQGGVVTLCNLFIFLLFGSFWILLLSKFGF